MVLGIAVPVIMKSLMSSESIMESMTSIFAGIMNTS